MTDSPPRARGLLEPSAQRDPRFVARGVVALLLGSCAALALAPLALPADYSSATHYLSEAAAQGLEGAWVARAGFLAFGVAVLWLAAERRARWPRLGYWAHGAFGLCMVATAAFSHRPWLEGLAFDAVEDALHSVTATGMGFAFAGGVAALLAIRGPGAGIARALDGVALAAAVVLPILGGLRDELAGSTQRAMFLIAYAWYAREALRARPGR